MKSVKEKLNSKRGVSIVLALLLMIVCVLGCLSIHTTISTAINQASLEKDHAQAMILASSISELIKNDIQDNPPSKAADTIIPPRDNTLSRYLYDNIGSNWNYYVPDSVFNSNLRLLTRTFPLTLSEDTNSTVELSMYWMSDSETETTQSWTSDARVLYVTVTVTSGERETGSVTMVYHYRESEGVYWWTYGESL